MDNRTNKLKKTFTNQKNNKPICDLIRIIFFIHNLFAINLPDFHQIWDKAIRRGILNPDHPWIEYLSGKPPNLSQDWLRIFIFSIYHQNIFKILREHVDRKEKNLTYNPKKGVYLEPKSFGVCGLVYKMFHAFIFLIKHIMQ